MSGAIDTLEHMFEYKRMSGHTRAERIRELRARIREMEPAHLNERVIPTHPDIAALLPGGGLQQGAAYSMDHSAMLLITLLAEPSQQGSWCAIVGMPEFGTEAAHRAGINLERLVLVPRPGQHWLTVASALADVMGIVVLTPPRRVPEQTLSRFHARLRERGTTVLARGHWPGSEAHISLSHSSWTGLGDGYGYLAQREATVTVTHRSTGVPRSTRLQWPAVSGVARTVAPRVSTDHVAAQQPAAVPQSAAPHSSGAHDQAQQLSMAVAG